MNRGQEYARRFVAEVKSGLSDAVLLKKNGLAKLKFFLYGASALDIIANEKMMESRQKRKIDPYRVLADVESGTDDKALMVKYEFNVRGARRFAAIHRGRACFSPRDFRASGQPWVMGEKHSAKWGKLSRR